MTTEDIVSQGRLGSEVGLLSDFQILERIVSTDDELLIFVSPLIDPETQIGPCSLDLRLGSEIMVMRNSSRTHVDLSAGKARIREHERRIYDKRFDDPQDGFVLHPGEFALAETLEYLCLPSDIAGRLEGRSTIGRQGLQVHATAGFVDPGFKGVLTFELINSGRLPVRMKPGLRIGQICFYRVKSVEVGYLDKPYSKYGERTGVELSRHDEEPEVD